MAVEASQPRVIEGFYPAGELETATPLRRLAGAILDALLTGGAAFLAASFILAAFVADEGEAGAAIFVVAIGVAIIVGYLAWYLAAARRGQTPGKQLLGTYIMRDDGSRAGGWYTLLREVVVEGLLFGVINSFTFGLAGIVGALWCTWDRDRQCLWDKLTSTYVAYSPEGRRPLTKAEFLERSSLPPRDR